MATAPPTNMVKTWREETKIYRIPNEALSEWLGFNALIVVSSCIAIMLLLRFLDACLMPLIYGAETLKNFTPRDRRSFVFHHAAGPIKFVVLAAGVYPFWHIVVGEARLSTIISRGGGVTMGDVILVSVQLFCALYVMELCYRAETISLLSIAHHVATVMVANVAFGISAYPNDYQEASVEIYLCLVWGFFDLIATAPLDPVLVARRLIRTTQPRLIRNSLWFTAAWSLSLTMLEIIATGVLLAASWSRLGTEVRILIPLLFSIWCASQFHLVYVLYQLGVSQKEHIKAEVEGRDEAGSAEKGKGSSSESVDSAVCTSSQHLVRV